MTHWIGVLDCVCVSEHGHCCVGMWPHAGAHCVALSVVGPSVLYNNDLSETRASENRDNPQKLSD